MLVEVANQNMVGGALDKATELLQEMRESIRLKIGRPDLSSSVFAVQGGKEVSKYGNTVHSCIHVHLSLIHI